MKYITDTHTLVWFFTNDSRLRPSRDGYGAGGVNQEYPNISAYPKWFPLEKLCHETKYEYGVNFL
jgi:hypothetical protein